MFAKGNIKHDLFFAECDKHDMHVMINTQYCWWIIEDTLKILGEQFFSILYIPVYKTSFKYQNHP